MVELGSGAERKVDDYMLTRYACYLIAQNADSRKRPVAFAQTYFAIQTRRQEMADKEKAIAMSEDEKRVFIRDQIKEHNKYLSSTAKDAGVETQKEFEIFHGQGYQGLYGMSVAQIKKRKKLNTKDKLLDRMGSTELAANFFKVTQTEEKLRKDNIKGKEKAYKTHYEVGRQVRDAMLKISGVAPEDLPPAENIKEARKRLKNKENEERLEYENNSENILNIESDNVQEIDISKDLWKYALLIIAVSENGEIKTSDLIKELPKYVYVPEEAKEILKGRKDDKFSQIVRNLKSHKVLLNKGYVEHTKRGFIITQDGIEFVKKYFKDRI